MICIFKKSQFNLENIQFHAMVNGLLFLTAEFLILRELILSKNSLALERCLINRKPYPKNKKKMK